MVKAFGIVYLVTNIINGKFYVGKTTKTLSRRKTEHFSQQNPGRVFDNALRKYGKNAFCWEILCECSSKEELNGQEIYFIKKYKSCILEGNGGYNMTWGGDGGIFGDANPAKRPEVREKLRQLNLGDRNPVKRPDVRDKISKTLSGRRLSKSHREAISEGMLGRYTPKGEDNWFSKKYLITFPDGTQKIIKGLLEFCKQNNLSYNRIRYAQRAKKSSTDGFKCELI